MLLSSLFTVRNYLFCKTRLLIIVLINFYLIQVANIYVMNSDSYLMRTFSQDNRVAESEMALADMLVGFD